MPTQCALFGRDFDVEIVEFVTIRLCGRRQFAATVKVLAPQLVQNHRPDFLVGMPHGWAGCRKVVLDQLVQLWQRMVR